MHTSADRDKAELSRVHESQSPTNSITPNTLKQLNADDKKVFMRMNPAEYVEYANLNVNSTDYDAQSLA